MRAVVNTLLRAMFSIGIAAGTVHAAPGSGPSENETQLAVQGSTKDSCAAHGALCVTAGSTGTLPAPAVVAAAPGTAVVTETSPGFLRVIPSGARKDLDKESLPWTLDVSATFVRKSVAGNAMFILRDTQDPDQNAETKMVTALWQATIPSAEGLAVRIFLNTQDGFHSGHTYQLRVVQILEGKEVALATGDLRLL